MLAEKRVVGGPELGPDIDGHHLGLGTHGRQQHGVVEGGAAAMRAALDDDLGLRVVDYFLLHPHVHRVLDDADAQEINPGRVVIPVDVEKRVYYRADKELVGRVHDGAEDFFEHGW